MSAISDLRGLLAIVERSDWREFYLRTGDWTVFMARPGGGPDPMMSGGEEPVAYGPTTAITAPHIATFLSALPVASEIEVGGVLAQIELLGETIDVVSDQAGVVTALLVEPGVLVEYGQPLVEIATA